MDWIWKAALSALGVLLVLGAAQRCGHRVAGFVSAMPWITAPALGWLAHEQGVAFAVAAAIASVAACAMLSAFAFLYAVACRRRGVGFALLAGSAGAFAMMLPTVAASARLAEALTLALGSCAIALRAMPATAGVCSTGAVRRSGRSLVGLALAAGVTSVLSAALGAALGAIAAGLLASLPVVTGAVALAEHAAGRPAAAASFLRGYVGGLAGRAAFGAVFVLLATRLGTPAALTLGVIVAGLSSRLHPCRGVDAGALGRTARALRRLTSCERTRHARSSRPKTPARRCKCSQ